MKPKPKKKVFLPQFSYNGTLSTNPTELEHQTMTNYSAASMNTSILSSLRSSKRSLNPAQNGNIRPRPHVGGSHKIIEPRTHHNLYQVRFRIHENKANIFQSSKVVHKIGAKLDSSFNFNEYRKIPDDLDFEEDHTPPEGNRNNLKIIGLEELEGEESSPTSYDDNDHQNCFFNSQKQRLETKSYINNFEESGNGDLNGIYGLDIGDYHINFQDFVQAILSSVNELNRSLEDWDRSDLALMALPAFGKPTFTDLVRYRLIEEMLSEHQDYLTSTDFLQKLDYC